MNQASTCRGKKTIDRINNVIRKMQADQIATKEQVIRYLTGESTEAEKLMIEKWVKMSAENKLYFDEIEFLWRASGVNKTMSEADKADDWNKILGRIGVPSDSSKELTRVRSIKSGKVPGYFLKIAAVFFLAFSVSWASIYFLKLRPDSGSIAYNQIITVKGQKSQLILSDGTKVWLNSETSLKYPATFSDRQREVYLEGEAFFEVQKKEGKTPFFVHTSDMDIEVLGTRFNVMAYADEETVETTLVEGSINVIRRGLQPSSDQQLMLKPNQKITLIKEGSKAVLSELESNKPSLVISGKGTSNHSPSEKVQILVSSSVDVELHTAWKDDRLIFQSETLENIAYKLERWYDVKIHIQDEELKSYSYTGEFAHKETLPQVMEILNLTTPIHFTFEKNDLYIDKVRD